MIFAFGFYFSFLFFISDFYFWFLFLIFISNLHFQFLFFISISDFRFLFFIFVSDLYFRFLLFISVFHLRFPFLIHFPYFYFSKCQVCPLIHFTFLLLLHTYFSSPAAYLFHEKAKTPSGFYQPPQTGAEYNTKCSLTYDFFLFHRLCLRLHVGGSDFPCKRRNVSKPWFSLRSVAACLRDWHSLIFGCIIPS